MHLASEISFSSRDECIEFYIKEEGSKVTFFTSAFVVIQIISCGNKKAFHSFVNKFFISFFMKGFVYESKRK